MKVLYDITTLAHIYNANVNPAGIYRHVENVAIGLSQIKKIDLWFSSKPGQIYNSKKYLKSTNKLTEFKFRYASTDFDNLMGNIFFDTNVIEQDSLFFNKDTVNFITDNLINNYNSFNIAEKQFDILHYNWRGLDEMPKPCSHLRHIDFVTVFDLIALKNPELFGSKGVNEELYIYLDNLLKSIQSGHCISVSTNAVKDDICNLYPHIDGSQIYVNYLGVSDNFFQCNDNDIISSVKIKYNIPYDEKYIICVNTIEPRKNMQAVIKAFQLITEEQNVNLNLILVGSKGWLYEDIIVGLNQLDNNINKIILTGYVDDIDLPILLSGADVFCYPSLDEGFGLPPLEAMKCGTPVVVSNIPAVAEVVGDAGILIDPNNVESIASAILKVVLDNVLQKELSNKGLIRANLFSWDICAKSTYESYKNAIQNRSN